MQRRRFIQQSAFAVSSLFAASVAKATSTKNKIDNAGISSELWHS